MRAAIDYFGGEKRFYVVACSLIILALMLFALLYLKADEVTKDPCSICAKKLNEDVVCTSSSSGMIVNRVFHPNMTFSDSIG